MIILLKAICFVQIALVIFLLWCFAESFKRNDREELDDALGAARAICIGFAAVFGFGAYGMALIIRSLG